MMIDSNKRQVAGANFDFQVRSIDHKPIDSIEQRQLSLQSGDL
jgi:hypothetical protein